MLQKKVFEIYKKLFIFNEEVIDTWFQNGYNSVRIRFTNKKEVVFTYHDDTNWRLEPVEKFIESMNKK